MGTACSRMVWTVSMISLSAAAWADSPPQKPRPPQEPAGFITGGIIGGFAAGPIGAVVGAGIGTWLGNRVHRASEAKKAEAEVAALKAGNSDLAAKTVALETKAAALETARGDLAETNLALSSRLDQLSHSVDAAQAARDDAAREDAAKVLDGLEGDVLFRTGSAEITPEMAHGIKILADAVAKSPAVKVRVDGYADPRGTVDGNIKLSQARANAVRDLFLAAGVDDEALEVNAYGKSQSVALDPDGYAMERKVRLTLQAAESAPVARAVTQPTATADGSTADMDVDQTREDE